MAETRLRLEWETGEPWDKATLGDYFLGVTPHVGSGWMWEIATAYMQPDKTCEIGFADTQLTAQLAAEAALFARLEVYRPLLTDAENAALRKAMPNADMLFNAAYLLRGTWDDTCIAMAPSLEAAAARILAPDADDDAQKIDALVELLRRA